MLRDEAVEAAFNWLLQVDYRRPGTGVLRFAAYVWDFRSGFGLWGGHYTRRLISVPTPDEPEGYWLVHGWVVVFEPSDRVPEGPDDRLVVWVPESGDDIRGRVPRYQGEPAGCLR